MLLDWHYAWGATRDGKFVGARLNDPTNVRRNVDWLADMAKRDRVELVSFADAAEYEAWRFGRPVFTNPCVENRHDEAHPNH